MRIEELAAEAGVTVRTVRYYITQGLLPGPGTRGRLTTYREAHRLRLRLIRALADARMPIPDIRTRIASMTDEAVATLLADVNSDARTLDGSNPDSYVANFLTRQQRIRPDAHGLRSGADATLIEMEEPVGALGFYAPPEANPIRAIPLRATPTTDLPSSGAVWRRVPVAPGIELHIDEAVWTKYEVRLTRRLDTLRRDLGSVVARDAGDERP